MTRKFMQAMVVLVVLLFGTAAFAKTCPKLWKQVDEKLPTASLSAEQKAKVKEMRDQGEALHKQGKHADSEKILREAMAMVGIK